MAMNVQFQFMYWVILIKQIDLRHFLIYSIIPISVKYIIQYDIIL